MPNGPTGVLCTSVPNPGNTGVFGGSSICGTAEINNDRSSNDVTTWTAEMLISSKLDGPFNFLVGATYLDNKVVETHYNVESFNLDYSTAVIGALTSLGRTLQGATTAPSYRGPTYFDSFTPFYQLKSYGIFGEVYWEPSDQFKLTLGIRYNNDKKEVQARNQLFNFLIPYGSTDAFASPFAGGYDADPTTVCAVAGATTAGAYGSIAGCEAYAFRSTNFDAVTGRVVLDYRITDDNLLYASYSRGYKSGGINPPLAPGLAATTNFNPEFVNAFEIGTKNKFGNGELTLNASAFYYQYKGMQLSRIVNRTSVNDNVDANIYGFEVEAIIRPIRPLSINIGFSYLHTEVSGDLLVQNPRDPAAGRADAVILKDMGAGFNCVVTPNTAGNTAGVQTMVTAFNGALGLAGPTAFPTGSGVLATGAFSLCDNLAAAIANPSAALRALFATPTGALPFTVTNVGLLQNIRGKQLPQAPNYKWNVGIQYDIAMDNGMSVVPRVDLIYVGDSFGNIFNGAINRVAGYSMINAQIQINGPDDKWYLRGFVQNLSDSSAITGLAVNDQSQGLATNIFTLEPRRYGVAVGFKF
jgi:outer membrane receptor protein involved in Fe transport